MNSLQLLASAKEHASQRRIDVTLRDLHDGLVIPLDLPGAREKSLDAFDLSIEPAVEHVHRCC